MNDTLNIIANRRSVRGYSDEPVTDEEKAAILSATLRSPTAGNLMLYTIVEVEDQSIKDKLAESCDHQPFIAKSPYVLLFLADYQRWFDYFKHCRVEERVTELNNRTYLKPQAGDMLLACCDALIAAQTAVIAAESMGISSCYIGDILENYEYHRDLFNLPPYTLPITMLCFGHPAVKNPGKLTTRLSREAVVHKNTYHRAGAAELGAIFGDMEEKFKAGPHRAEFENAGQGVYFRKFAADFAIEMNRSVNKMLENWA
jgi:FMN reductase (NADPH)/FMN reductase [NAD(P)H]